MNPRISFKGFCISMGVLLGILYLGTPSEPKPITTKWEAPEKGKWCLGYDYKNKRYRYHSESKDSPTKSSNIRDHHEVIDLNDNGNFTREQVKDIENYINSRSPKYEHDIEDIIDNLEYYH